MAEAPNPANPTPTLPANGAAADVDLSGHVLGDFKLLHRLGQGGMGQVYVAEQLSLRRKVALKLLRPELASNTTSLQRFKAEAEAVARATHANIVQIHAIGQSSGLNFMALEYVEGRNLREYVEKKGPPDVLLGLGIMAQIAAALQRASELGIVHRDIKPENILITKKGEVKVADFGLSRCFDEPLNLTQTGVTMGTPLYMSPEQFDKKPVDHRSDIYSFGAMSYFMFTGHPPFRGESPYEVAYQHVHKDPEPLGDIRPDLPAELPAIIHRMMAKPPEARYQTGREVLRDVTRLRDILIVAGSGPMPLTPSGSLPGLSAEFPPSRTQPVPTRSRWPLVVAAAVVLALGGGLFAGWLQQRDPENAAAPAPGVPGGDDVNPARALYTAREREKELQRLVKEHLPPGSRLDQMVGLKHSLELGLFYLREKRLDDAEQLFKEVGNAGVKVYPYHVLSQLGKAMVLAFRDEPAESNKQFVTTVAEFEKVEKFVGTKPLPPGLRKDVKLYGERIETYDLLWKNNPPLREMVARALNHNHRNAPEAFPPELEAYRHPPRPVIRGAPQ